MPPHKRLYQDLVDDAMNSERNKHEHPLVEVELDQTQLMNVEDDDGYLAVKLSEVRKEVQCPICLGIIRRTRAVMECMHRFCRDCIEKSMRLGNNECPACRTHCSSRRSLRDDPNFDALIAALYPDIDKYEEEELALHAAQMTRTLQTMRVSYAGTLKRQTEAVGKKRNAKATAAAFVRRSQGNLRTPNLRRSRNFRLTVELPGSNGNEDMNHNHGGRVLSPIEEETETMSEAMPERSKRGGETQFPQHIVTTTVADGAVQENVPQVTREILSSSATLAWGKNGQRSHTRANNKNAARTNRLSRLVEHLQSSEQNDDELDIHLKLVTFDERRAPNLQRPYLCCRPTLSVKQLCQYVAFQTSLQTEEVELYLVKEFQANIIRGEGKLDPSKDKSHILREQQTLAELKTNNFCCGHLLMAYKRKMWNLNAAACEE